jgi:hypothetical protein
MPYYVVSGLSSVFVLWGLKVSEPKLGPDLKLERGREKNVE